MSNLALVKVEEKTLKQKSYNSDNEEPNQTARLRNVFAARFHDLVFLSSYVYDAVFNMRQFALKGGQLRISMQRERWERYNDRKRLESISSLLTIEPGAFCEMAMQGTVAARKK
jgi:hypothetical protein